ncbi:uncharacterized protein BKA55DRAFT_543730 [Fusarium redolens]|uniref:Fungal STAND N-terminal Goodbye domain-containing protein n=1 Tax=Fusarium redolens TaxID=48865 RepID=A0A9P9GEK2_FUSRE|nr:uncharacterized protein BKA55DRAFT_543730 [Fusarium redolens]KAH7237095.1 hypothetical protein BKA55DRAFT_543730 [Fusarium redolens]
MHPTEIEKYDHPLPVWQPLWDEAAERFLARTGKGLNRNHPMILDDVRKQIESRTESATDVDIANTLKHKKEIGLNILECLKLLGGIAAQGASLDDITTVQNFLWTLFQKSVVEKFEFEPLAGQINRTKGEIRVNEYDAHLAIVMQALNFLIKKPDARTERLGRYQVWNLPVHLKELKNPEPDHKVDNAAKKDIGNILFDILGQGTIIRRHWERFVDVPLFCNAMQISTILAWLQDPDVTGHFGIYQMNWLDKVVSEGESDVCDDSIVILSTDEESVALDKVTNEQSLWYERVGETARKVDEFDHAIAMFLKATKMPGASWTCHRGLARSYHQAGNMNDACESMKKALEILTGLKDPNPNDIWVTNMDLGKWYFELKEPDLATPADDEAYYRILEANLTSKSQDRALSLIESMSHDTSAKGGISRLGSALLLMATDDETYDRHFTSILSLTASRDGMLGIVLNAMEEAIQLAADNDLLFERSALRLYKGLALYYYGDEAD